MEAQKNKNNLKTAVIYCGMIAIFGALIYLALGMGERFDHTADVPVSGDTPGAFDVFVNTVQGHIGSHFVTLLIQITLILLTVRFFSLLFRRIGQPGVVGEIVAGIVLGPSLLGAFFPQIFNFIFPESSFETLGMLSQVGLVLFMFVIGLEVDFNILKNKLNQTLVISHAGIIVPFFMGVAASIWVYEEYAAMHTPFIPFALFIGISMSITAFPVLARVLEEKGILRSNIGVLAIASAANDDVTAWCLMAMVIAIARAGIFVSALFTIGVTVGYIVFMFFVLRPVLEKLGKKHIRDGNVSNSFVGFIFIIMVISAAATEIIGIHAIFGAFIAGIIMPKGLGFRNAMIDKVKDISLVLFIPLFFAFTGLRTRIGLINTPELWGVCVVFILFATAGKLGGCSVAARLTGERWRESFVIGTLMNTRGLMELIALNIGYEMGILPPEIFVIMVIMALVTTFMTTPVINSQLRHLKG